MNKYADYFVQARGGSSCTNNALAHVTHDKNRTRPTTAAMISSFEPAASKTIIGHESTPDPETNIKSQNTQLGDPFFLPDIRHTLIQE